MAIFGFGGPSIRPAAVAGSFYPADKGELRAELAACFKEAASMAHPEDGTPLAVIAPHAGYVYSGAVAAAAFSTIPADAAFDRIILIGPSHRAAFDGAAIDLSHSAWNTPLGDVPLDASFARQLAGEKPFLERPDVFSGEHDLEVQLPFLQYRLKTLPPIVPIILGTLRYGVLKAVADALRPCLEEGKTLFVISSDFSHYPGYEGAVEADSRCAEAISSGSVAEFAKALKDNHDAKIRGLETSACGQGAIAVLMEMTAGGPFRYEHLAYRNSGDSSFGGRDKVVGYHAFAVYRTTEQYSLDQEEMQTLLEIARGSIAGSFKGRTLAQSWDGKSLSEKLKAGGGAFVTLNENGRLRGCIGRFGDDTPVYRLVAQMARSAAFDDPRFTPLRESELDRVKIEISVLSPLKRIASADEFVPGRDGIYMVKGYNSGTFLPQVADDTGWSREELLGHCARDKAGIGWDGWKTAELYTYGAVVFSEE